MSQIDTDAKNVTLNLTYVV